MTKSKFYISRILRTTFFLTSIVSICIFISCKEEDFKNTNPVIEDQSFTLAENSSDGTVIGTVNASDPDMGQVLTFTIISGNTNNTFALSTDGELSVNDMSALDFELNGSFTLTVEVKDDFDGEDEAEIVITITDVNETHVMGNKSFSANENSQFGLVIGTMTYSDPDVDEQLVFSISSGNSNEAFSINNSGEITVNNEEALDFESSQSFELTIDLVDDSNILVQATCMISILDVDEIHVVDNQSFSIEENSADGTVVGSIVVQDPEDGSFNYSITSGNDSGIFGINSLGEISATTSCDLNFEATSSYFLGISVSDSEFDVSAQITIEVSDVDEIFIDNGLVAFYSFDGSANDASNNLNAGVVSGATLTDGLDDCGNSAYSLDGINDRINVNELVSATSSNSNGSFSFWVKVPNAIPSTPNAFLSFGDRNSRNFILAYLWSDGLLRFAGVKNFVDNFIVVSNNVELVSDTWHHLVFVQDGVQPRMYVDGTQILTSNMTANDLTIWLSDVPSIDNAAIGTLDQNNAVQWYLDGDIDNLRVYNRVLSESEVQVLYNNEKP